MEKSPKLMMVDQRQQREEVEMLILDQNNEASAFVAGVGAELGFVTVGGNTANINYHGGGFNYTGRISQLGVVAAAAVPIFGPVQRKKRMARQRRSFASTATTMMEYPSHVSRSYKASSSSTRVSEPYFFFSLFFLDFFFIIQGLRRRSHQWQLTFFSFQLQMLASLLS